MQKDIVFSNSMVEAANKRLKYDFLFTRELADFGSVKKFLETAVPSYNNKPHKKKKIKILMVMK